MKQRKYRIATDGEKGNRIFVEYFVEVPEKEEGASYTMCEIKN